MNESMNLAATIIVWAVSVAAVLGLVFMVVSLVTEWWRDIVRLREASQDWIRLSTVGARLTHYSGLDGATVDRLMRLLRK